FSSRRRHTRCLSDWSSDVCSSDLDTLSETGLARFRRRQVGMIFQFFNLLDDMTVEDNILLPAQLAGLPAAQARQRGEELMAALRSEERRVGRERRAAMSGVSAEVH